jgi:hypothetical protein
MIPVTAQTPQEMLLSPLVCARGIALRWITPLAGGGYYRKPAGVIQATRLAAPQGPKRPLRMCVQYLRWVGRYGHHPCKGLVPLSRSRVIRSQHNTSSDTLGHSAKWAGCVEWVVYGRQNA